MIHVIGGCYHEVCLSPSVTQFYGSGGRAAAALASASLPVCLHTYASPTGARHVRRLAALSNFDIQLYESDSEITFAYQYPLAAPLIDPALSTVQPGPLIELKGDACLLFGMVEGFGRVNVNTAVYDPQSTTRPMGFRESGSKAKRLAIICNNHEAVELAQAPLNQAARRIMDSESADVVVVKNGASGASVLSHTGKAQIPAYHADHVFSIGSGDMFAAAFTYAWVFHELDPESAADWASRAVARYVDTRSDFLPVYSDIADKRPVTVQSGCVYIAGPFFTMSQRWLVEEARAFFLSNGLDVFSPMHEVGFGPAEVVGPADIAGLIKSDCLFAILDTLDAGTLFEAGYARGKGIPVYAYSEVIGEEDCKILTGTDCRLMRDFASALFATAWRI